MKALSIVLILFGLISLVEAQNIGPGGREKYNYGPDKLCSGINCIHINYTIVGKFVIAEGQLKNGYPQLGWSGPCENEDVSTCPDLWYYAAQDLEINLIRINHALNILH